MEAPAARRLVLVAVLVLAAAGGSECVRCFARFDQVLGECKDELGDVDEDDCCQNPGYGYHDDSGTCKYCGPAVLSPWSQWSDCNVLCGDGVTQRHRKYFGVGDPEHRSQEANLEIRPCTGTCCNAKGWSQWLAWSPCSVSCAGSGVRKRRRVCSDPPECHNACNGDSEETEACRAHSPCPVHGGWSDWSNWLPCSGTCISSVSDVTKKRYRYCSNPAPSTDTVPPGNSCPGDDSMVKPCSEVPNCPVDGSWGAWSPAGKCSVTCGEGLQLSTRTCDLPAPKYGGRWCVGQSTRSSVCQNTCPVDGFWSGWSSWGECSSSCIGQSRPPTRTRHRSCSNPAPSSSPAGRGCQGDKIQTENCNQLPHCPVNGLWGSWSSFSSCPVTCGVGLQVSTRKCDSPAPNHGGRPCQGAARRTNVCKTRVHCPVDGMWSEWSSWTQCKFPFSKDIKCKHLGGSQNRERQCVHRAHNGSFCGGDGLTQTRVCYDVNDCYLKGTWEGWEPWSLCKPTCGEGSKRFRRRYCKPDYSEYSPTIGRQRQPATFFGRPRADCGDPPDGGKKIEIQLCLNLPACL